MQVLYRQVPLGHDVFIAPACSPTHLRPLSFSCGRGARGKWKDNSQDAVLQRVMCPFHCPALVSITSYREIRRTNARVSAKLLLRSDLLTFEVVSAIKQQRANFSSARKMPIRETQISFRETAEHHMKSPRYSFGQILRQQAR